jgi:hypothetical protein
VKITVTCEQGPEGLTFDIPSFGDWNTAIDGDDIYVDIATPQGMFTVSFARHRHAGITVDLDGEEVWSSQGLTEQVAAAAATRAAEPHPTRSMVEHVLRQREWKENTRFPGTWYHPTDSGLWVIFDDACAPNDLAVAKNQNGMMKPEEFKALCAVERERQEAVMGGMDESWDLRSRQAGELQVATHAFCAALKRAGIPYRGLGISVQAIVNQILEPEGYRLLALTDPGRPAVWG